MGHGERRRGRERERKRAGSAILSVVCDDVCPTRPDRTGTSYEGERFRTRAASSIDGASGGAHPRGRYHAATRSLGSRDRGPQVSQGGVVCGGVASAAYSIFSRGKCAKHTVAHDMRRHSRGCRFFPKHNAYGIPCGVRGRCRERRWMEMTENDDATRCSTSPEVRGERGGSCDIVFPTPHKPIACCSQRHSALLADGSLISKVAQGHRQSSRGGKNVACEPGPNIGRFHETMRR